MSSLHESEFEGWAESSLNSTEVTDLTADTLAAVTILADTLESSTGYGITDGYKAVAEISDGKDEPQSVLSLEAVIGPKPEGWQFNPLPGWIIKIHLDEKMLALNGYSKAATVFRRTFIGLNPTAEKPIRVARSHELRRRSQHRFARAKNNAERAALRGYSAFERTDIVHGDRLLLQAALDTLTKSADMVEFGQGED